VSRSRTDTNLFLEVNQFVQRTDWLHGPLTMYAEYGILLFAGLLVIGWFVARRRGIARMVALVWAGLGTVVAVAVNQPLVQLFHAARPYTNLHQILVLATPSTDFSFPSDHSTMAGALTAGLFLVYIAAHYPYDVLAGLTLGAAVVLLGYPLVRRPLSSLVTRMADTRLRPLVTDVSAAPEA
jgi:membrane-associated phospholipid phosphatase